MLRVHTPTIVIAVATLIRFSGSGPWVATLISVPTLSILLCESVFFLILPPLCGAEGPWAATLGFGTAITKLGVLVFLTNVFSEASTGARVLGYRFWVIKRAQTGGSV